MPLACCSTLRKPSLLTKSRTPTESVAGLGVAVVDFTGRGVGVLDGLRTGVAFRVGVGVGEIQGVLDRVGLGAGVGVLVVPQDVVTAKPAMTNAAVMARWVRRLNTGRPWL